MADKYQALREALVKNVKFHGNASYAYDMPEWGDAANPATIQALLAERDAMRKALQFARQTLTVAIRVAWEDDSADVSDHLTIKAIDAALTE